MQGLLKNRWWVVVGSFIGCGVDNGVVMAFTFGLFLKPVAAEFGWSRAQVAAALAIAGVTSALSSPIWGKLIDRFGIKPVTLCAVTFFGCAMASIALTPPVLPVFLLLYAVAGVASAGASPLPYAKAITGRFDRRRGLALGIAVAGVGVGGMLVPQATRLLIDDFGWRSGYVGVGAIAFVAFPAVALLLREPVGRPIVPRRAARRAATEFQETADKDRTNDPTPESSATALLKAPSASDVPSSPEQPGLTFDDAMRGGYPFWALTGAFLLAATAIAGTANHIVPLLTDAGMSSKMATLAFSTGGLALILGRISSGILADRMFAPTVTIAFLLTPMAGILLLGFGHGDTLPFAGAFLIGIGVGGEIDLIAFLTSRYFGLRSFGALYGYLTGLYYLGANSGPFLMDLVYDHAGSYQPALLGAASLLLVSSLMISRLGPYRYAVGKMADTDVESAATSAVALSPLSASEGRGADRDLGCTYEAGAPF